MARHVYLCPLRWSDMDAYQHVNNVQYLRYLEDARVHMLATHAKENAADILRSGVVVVSHQIAYRYPLVYRPEPVPIETWVSKAGAVSFTISYEIKDPDRLYATASTVLAAFDFTTEKLRRLTPDERSLLAGYVDEGCVNQS
jgi:acyl-CoA thioester hydrolase